MHSFLLHESKNLITMIVSRLEMLSHQWPQDEAMKPSIDVIDTSFHRLDGLFKVMDVLNNPDALSASLIHLTDIFSTLLLQLEAEFLKREISVSESISETPPFLGHEPLLYHVLFNLLFNAMEAITGPGKISITVGRDAKDNRINIEIKDTGCGINRDDIPKLFEYGFSTKERGSGSGLYWVKQIVDAHFGEISFVSEKSVGTTATLFLPTDLAEDHRFSVFVPSPYDFKAIREVIPALEHLRSEFKTQLALSSDKDRFEMTLKRLRQATLDLSYLLQSQQ